MVDAREPPNDIQMEIETKVNLRNTSFSEMDGSDSELEEGVVTKAAATKGISGDQEPNRPVENSPKDAVQITLEKSDQNSTPSFDNSKRKRTACSRKSNRKIILPKRFTDSDHQSDFEEDPKEYSYPIPNKKPSEQSDKVLDTAYLGSDKQLPKGQSKSVKTMSIDELQARIADLTQQLENERSKLKKAVSSHGAMYQKWMKKSTSWEQREGKARFAMSKAGKLDVVREFLEGLGHTEAQIRRLLPLAPLSWAQNKADKTKAQKLKEVKGISGGGQVPWTEEELAEACYQVFLAFHCIVGQFQAVNLGLKLHFPQGYLK